MGVKGLKFSILHHGWIECDQQFLQQADRGNKQNHTPAAVWMRVPVISVLLFHPAHGCILYDGGACDGDVYGAGRRPAEHERFMPFYAEPENRIENQLALCGVDLSDLRTVIISHAHWEHMGVLEHIGKCKTPPRVLVPKADYAYGLAETHKARRDVFCTYLYQNFEFENIRYTYVEEESEIAPGVRLLLLGGHAPAILGVFLEAESGNYLFPSDAVMNEANLSAMVSHTAMLYDSLRYFSDVKRLQELARTHAATMIFPHDAAQFAGLKAAPFAY